MKLILPEVGIMFHYYSEMRDKNINLYVILYTLYFIGT